MRRAILILPLLASGCGTAIPGGADAACAASRAARADLAAAVAATPDDRAAIGTRLVDLAHNLIEIIDATCAK